MKQISIFIENEKGKLAKVSSLLAESEVDLRALSIADTTDYGILRIVADKPEVACDVLTNNGFLTKISDVVGVEIEDKPGSLSKIIRALSDADIAVEYTYAFTSAKPGTAFMVFRVDDNQKAIIALRSAGIGATL